jgi:hypothetical protein
MTVEGIVPVESFARRKFDWHFLWHQKFVNRWWSVGERQIRLDRKHNRKSNFVFGTQFVVQPKIEQF